MLGDGKSVIKLQNHASPTSYDRQGGMTKLITSADGFYQSNIRKLINFNQAQHDISYAMLAKFYD